MTSDVSTSNEPRRVARALADALESTLGEAADQTTRQLRTDIKDIPREIERVIHRAIESQLEPFKSTIAALRERVDDVEQHLGALITKRVDDAQTVLERKLTQSRTETSTEIKDLTQATATTDALAKATESLMQTFVGAAEGLETAISERTAVTNHHLAKASDQIVELFDFVDTRYSEMSVAFQALRNPVESLAAHVDMLEVLTARLEAFEPKLEALTPKIDAGPAAIRGLDDRISLFEDAQHHTLLSLRSLKRQVAILTSIVVTLAVVGVIALSAKLISP